MTNTPERQFLTIEEEPNPWSCCNSVDGIPLEEMQREITQVLLLIY